MAKNEKNTRICPHDGSLMHRDARPLTLENNRTSETFPHVEGWYCDQCDEAIYDPKDAQKISRLWNGLRARSIGYLDGTEIRRIRKKLGLSQQEAGILIGGGPRAFQKYESGDVFQSRAIDSWLRRLDSDPSQLAFLEERQKELMKKIYTHPASRKTMAIHVTE